MTRFVYEFEEEGSKSLTIDYSDEGDEELRAHFQDGAVYIAGNSSGLLTLARILVKLARGSYPDGYHLDIAEDFDADKARILCVGLSRNS